MPAPSAPTATMAARMDSFVLMLIPLLPGFGSGNGTASALTAQADAPGPGPGRTRVELDRPDGDRPAAAGGVRRCRRGDHAQEVAAPGCGDHGLRVVRA